MTKKLEAVGNNPVNTDEYYFGSIEVVTLDPVAYPQFELPIFAIADIEDGGNGVCAGPNDRSRIPCK